MNNQSSSQLKALARGQLLGKYKVVIAATILISLITFTVSLFASSFVNIDTITGIIINYIISYVVEIITGVFIVGFIVLNLNMICNKPFFISDIYYGFHNHTNKIIVVKFFITTLELLATLPCMICINLLQYHFSYFLLSLVLLTSIPAVVITIFIELNLSMAYYLLLDFPEYSSKDILLLSIKIMKNQKGRLFYLMVSFIPIFLLALLPVGLGLLWIIPYYRMTLTYFYLDIISTQ
jgi:uncharacterized membrane protein